MGNSHHLGRHPAAGARDPRHPLRFGALSLHIGVDLALIRALGLLLLFAASGAGAQMYKCVDERGKIHYTDRPQAGCKETAIKPSPRISGEVRPRQEDFANDEAAFKRHQLEREAKDAKERKALEQRCAKLRQERAVLSGGRRIARYDAKGELVFMDDAVRDQRLAQLEQELRGCP